MIGGWQGCSLLDYPGEPAAVIFTQGCNLRCRYCHNPELCPVRSAGPGMPTALEQLLDRRRGILGAVVVSGGEPCLHDGLPGLLESIRARGYRVKLDTNGMYPAVVARLAAAGLIDYAAVDVKVAPGESSQWLCGAPHQAESALQTLAILLEAGVDCEARTTAARETHPRDSLLATARKLVETGVPRWYIQPVNPVSMLDSGAGLTPPGTVELEEACVAGGKLGLAVSARGRGSGFPGGT